MSCLQPCIHHHEGICLSKLPAAMSLLESKPLIATDGMTWLGFSVIKCFGSSLLSLTLLCTLAACQYVTRKLFQSQSVCTS